MKGFDMINLRAIILGVLLGFFVGLPGYSFAQTLVAEFRMDEAQWTGASGEVIDSSGTANNGTARNGVNTADARVCRGGWFRGEGYHADPNNTWYPARYYVEVPRHAALSPLLEGNNAAMTLSGWFRPDSVGGVHTLVHKGEGGDSQEYRVHIEGARLTVTVWNRWGSPQSVTIPHTLAAGNWYFFAATIKRRGASGNVTLEAQLYGAASNDALASTSSGNVGIDFTGKNTSGRLLIGATAWSASNITNYFDGLIDELRIHGHTQNQDVNILALKNETRECVTDIELTCIHDDFNRGTLGDSWSTTHLSGSFGNPRIIGNRLRLTDASANVATAATFQHRFPSENNIVTLEFDFFAYGGNGADGIAIALSDAAITPAPGGYGGSLGYANRSGGINGFAGGWLGIGLDTFGNFSNPTEGRRGGPGRVRDAVAVRGSGSGTSGYAYITGTGTLSPTIRNSTGHRYRVTIDSQTAGQSWVTIERDTGSGYVELVGPVDILTATGQAAVPEDLLLTLTGSTGGSNDIHEIDNVQICALRMEPIEAEIHHFRIEHSGSGITCAAEPVRVIACANDNCTEQFSGQVELTLTPGSIWSPTGTPTIQFSGGERTVGFRRTSPGTSTLGIAGSTPAAANVTRCINFGGGSSPCAIVFDNFGILLDGNVPYDRKSAIPLQIAGKPSNQGFERADHRVRVVRASSEDDAVCLPAVENATLNARFRYTLPNPAEGLDNAVFNFYGEGSSTTVSAVGATGAVNLRFDENGHAPFHFIANDAGRYGLRVDVDIPVVDENDEPTGQTLTRNDSSNPFVVRPLAILIDTADNPRAANENGGVLGAAGSDFQLSAQPIAWTPGADPDENGQWGDCGDPPANPATTRVPTWNATLPGAQLYAPSGGVAGHLHVDDGTVDFSHAAAEGQKLASYTEVGIFTVRGTTHFPAPTSGTAVTVPVCSYRIGRFVPSHFTLSINTPLLENTCTSGAFTYSGQPFGFDQGSEPSATLSARNQSGQITRNYFGDYWKLAIDAPVLANRALSFDNAGDFEIIAPGQILWDGRQHSLGGEATFTLMNAEFRHLRPTTPVEPFTPRQHLRFNEYAFRDTDGTCLRPPEARACLPFEWTPPIEGTEIRWGRLSATTEHSPFEDQALSVPFTLEYFSAAGRFDTHTADTCSVLDTASVTLSGSLADIWSSAPPSLSPGVLPDGIWGLDLSAPGSPGFVDGIPDLGAAGLEWLRFDWSGSGAHDEDPRGRASWGIYRGNERVIRLREVW